MRRRILGHVRLVCSCVVGGVRVCVRARISCATGSLDGWPSRVPLPRWRCAWGCGPPFACGCPQSWSLAALPQGSPRHRGAEEGPPSTPALPAQPKGTCAYVTTMHAAGSSGVMHAAGSSGVISCAGARTCHAGTGGPHCTPPRRQPAFQSGQHVISCSAQPVRPYTSTHAHSEHDHRRVATQCTAQLVSVVTHQRLHTEDAFNARLWSHSGHHPRHHLVSHVGVGAVVGDLVPLFLGVVSCYRRSAHEGVHGCQGASRGPNPVRCGLHAVVRDQPRAGRHTIEGHTCGFCAPQLYQPRPGSGRQGGGGGL
jgi:hypothetical protein